MADTSEKPPIERLGLGLLIPDFVPLASDHHDGEVQPSQSSNPYPHGDCGSSPKGVVETIDGDEAELRNAIEIQVRQLIIGQAEWECGLEELLVLPDENGEGSKTERRGFVDHGKDEKDEESFESASGCGEVDDQSEGNVDEYTPGVSVVIGGEYNNNNHNNDNSNQSGYRRKVVLPVRPDAEDCAFYMKSGNCKFESYCKFNHPPRRRNQGVKEKVRNREENLEREGQAECKYYLTPGGCKYGKNCKYRHGSDRGSVSHVPSMNFLGLPIRPGEKECPYYLRTGSCKYGSNCRFHHPEPTSVAVGDSPSGFGNDEYHPPHLISSLTVSSWRSPRTYKDTSPFLPVIYPPTHGAPTPSSDLNGYQVSAYPTSESGLPTPPAFALRNLPSEINFPIQRHHELVVDEYPERPGEPECSFFLKTGDCKYKYTCKYHHPKNRPSKAKTNSYILNDKGLPLRPDQPICTHYHRYGLCKYGPACKYDHPVNFGMLPPPFEQKPSGDLRNFEGPGNFRKGNEC